MSALKRPDSVHMVEAFLRRRVVVLVAVRTLLSCEELLIIFFLLHLDAEIVLVCFVHATSLGLLDLQRVVQLSHIGDQNVMGLQIV